MRFRAPDRTYGGFIFDCDGTLADSMPLHYRAWLEALAEHHAAFEFSWSLFLKRAGMTQEQTVVELNAEFGTALDEVIVAGAQRRHFEQRMASIEPIAEVVAYARRVAGSQPVAVASGGERGAVERTLELIDVRSLFPIVVVAADVVRGKPAPDLFLLAAERMAVRASDCVVFEDSELGIVAARAAGMDAVRVEVTAPAWALETKTASAPR
jgi:HAD superfamily hydrolase (TIGR01509 family)